MKKRELIAQTAARSGLSQKVVAETMEAMTAAIAEQLKKGGQVQLTGFGTFKAVQRPQRKARNPQTGQVVIVEAKAVPQFKPGAGLKALLVGGGRGAGAGPDAFEEREAAFGGGTHGASGGPDD